MKSLFISALLLGMAACQSNPTIPATASVSAPEAAKAEWINVNTLTVNGQPHQPLTTQALKRQLGRPDSIAKGVVECGGELATQNSPVGDFWYYGKTMYEVNGPQAVLASFDVTAGKFEGKLGQLELNRNTTLEEASRFFPSSARDAAVPDAGHLEMKTMSLPFEYNGEQTDDHLNLIFEKGRLKEVEFYSPC